MANWFTELFGQVADAVGNAIGDIRDKLVFEGFFDRHIPERHGGDDPGSSHDQPAVQERAAGGALDMFYDRMSQAEHAQHFREPPEQQHGIER
jgi:hypothetical protein